MSERAECKHLSGYWIQYRWTFRCFACGCQFCMAEVPKQRGRKIEKWRTT